MVKISACLPVYKTEERHLRECIESVLWQTFGDFELLILDDCPEQPVRNIVESYHDKRIRYMQNPENLGISQTRNKLIEMAKGEYLAVIDHDDVSLPERFAKEAAYLDKHPETGVVSCFYKEITTQKIHCYPVDNLQICQELLFSSCVVHPAAMIRKSVLLQNNLQYEEMYSPSEDYALWCRLIGKTGFHNIPEVLFLYRNHENNTSHRQKDKMAAATQAIYAFVRRDNADLWDVVQSNSTFVKRISLFGFIPLVTIRHCGKKRKYLLFDLIPLIITKAKWSKKS